MKGSSSSESMDMFRVISVGLSDSLVTFTGNLLRCSQSTTGFPQIRSEVGLRWFKYSIVTDPLEGGGARGGGPAGVRT